jgi:hypothetical protein
LLLALLVGVAIASPVARAAEDDEDSKPKLEAAVRGEGEARRQALAVLAEPDFGRMEETTRWRWRNQGRSGDADKDYEDIARTWGFLGKMGKFFSSLAEVVRFALYGLMILALAAFVVFLYRNRYRFWPETPQKGVRPETLFGLDLRPEALPADIPAAALAEAEAGHWVTALSLLYRGALVTLIERNHVVFRVGDTEDLCLERVRARLQGEALTVFAALLADWVAAAYAGRLPTLARIRALCADWRVHFAASPAASKEGA